MNFCSWPQEQDSANQLNPVLFGQPIHDRRQSSNLEAHHNARGQTQIALTRAEEMGVDVVALETPR